MRPNNPIYGQYEAVCRHCGFRLIFSEAQSVGYKVGDPVLLDPTNEAKGRCNRCKRYDLRVTKVPDQPVKQGLRGFWKVPDK